MYVWYCDVQILPHVPVNIELLKSSLISSAHLKSYKYINIILNITMETDQFEAVPDNSKGVLKYPVTSVNDVFQVQIKR